MEREDGAMPEAIFRLFQRAFVSEIWPSKFGYREKSFRHSFARFPIKERTLSDLTLSVFRRRRRLKEARSIVGRSRLDIGYLLCSALPCESALPIRVCSET